MKVTLGFGAWRLFLALLVGFSHLWGSMLPGPAAYSVFGFFVLSGYLMTHVLQTKYGYTGQGLLAYARNRFLRIFPGFWVACVIGAVVLIALGHAGLDARRLNPSFGLPRDANEWGFLITLLPAFPRWNAPVPVANALSVEVGYYILIPLLAQHRTTAWFALVFGALVAANFGFTPGAFADRYALFLPAAPAFALGSLVCHYRQALQRIAMPGWSVGLWVAHWGGIFYNTSWPWTYGLYVSMLLSAWVVVSLAERKTGRTDAVFGELSYPFYLLHATAGACLLGVYGYDRPLVYALVAIALTAVASWLMVIAVDRPLTLLKSKPRAATLHANASSSLPHYNPATKAPPAPVAR
jgi:peptidoglycan/LPS O-acetylase OafA/YrhL